MKCEACGLDYQETHNCSAVPPTEEQLIAAEGSGFGHYLREAWRIVRWDDLAIRRVKDDPNALGYGLLIWTATNAISLLVILYTRSRHPERISPVAVLFLVAISLLYAATLGLIQLGIVHLAAKFFCAGEGKFVQVLRPLLLASFVYILQVIPVAGILIAGLAWVCVMVMVFDEVHGMPQLTSFLVSAGAGVALRILTGDIFRMPF